MINTSLSNDSHDNQYEQQEKVSEEGANTHNNTIDRDDDYFEFDPLISRHRSKLRVLYHAATCPCDELTRCPSGVVHCCASKRLFAHIVTCTFGDDCDVPGCQHSRRVWRHYRKCRHGQDRVENEHTGSFTTKNCYICSALPTRHDAIIFCDRFRSEKNMCRLATTSSNSDTGNTTDHENSTLRTEDFAAGRSWNFHTGDSHVQYDCLPVWRKRNLLHAQQQKLLQNVPPTYGKENTKCSTNFSALDNEKKYSRGGRNTRRSLHASDFSANHSVGQNRVGVGNYDTSTTNQASFSATTHHKLDMPNGRASDLSFSDSSGSAAPIRLPEHPRDARRRSRIADQSVPCRSSQRPLQDAHPIN